MWVRKNNFFLLSRFLAEAYPHCLLIKDRLTREKQTEVLSHHPPLPDAEKTPSQASGGFPYQCTCLLQKGDFHSVFSVSPVVALS